MSQKFKALRKKDTKEFVKIKQFGGVNILFTSEFPNPQPLSATIKMTETYYIVNNLPIDFSFDDLELVEFEIYETNTIGQDIRNKLTPSLNLISLLELYFGETGDKIFDEGNKYKLLPYIKKEMEKCKENIKYLSNIL